jgi:hypothetical protein
MRQGPGRLLLLLLLAIGCAEIGHLYALRSGLSREFQDDHLGISLANGMILTVTFENGPAVEAPCRSQAALAFRVAGYVRDHYQDFDSLWVVNVAFTQRRSFAPATAATSTNIPFRFSRTALHDGLSATDSADVFALCEWDIRGDSTSAR